MYVDIRCCLFLKWRLKTKKAANKTKILILSSISAEYADKTWLLYSKLYI